MTISRRSVKAAMRRILPDVPISDAAAELLRSHIEDRVRHITVHASKIQKRENELRTELGERLKLRLSPQQIKMAIENKFPGLMIENDHSKD